jgi:hypothetical protein
MSDHGNAAQRLMMWIGPLPAFVAARLAAHFVSGVRRSAEMPELVGGIGEEVFALSKAMRKTDSDAWQRVAARGHPAELFGAREHHIVNFRALTGCARRSFVVRSQ